MTYIDSEELAVRIAEGILGMSRPVDATATEALDQLEKESPDCVAGFRRAALFAANYIVDCCNAEYPGSAEVKQVTVSRGPNRLL